MPSTTPPQAELAELNREIERLEAEQVVLEDQRKKRATVARRAAWRGRYLRWASVLRRPSVKWEWWRIAVLVVGPAVGGVAVFVVVELLSGSTSIALLGFLIGAAAALGALTTLLFRPSDALLPGAIVESETQARLTNAHWTEAFERLTQVKERLTRLVEDRRTRMASGRVQRAALLQRPWKGMSGVEWEDFVVEVCRTLGATVARRGQIAEGAELTAVFGERRVAVLAANSREALNSDVVQRVIGMKTRDGCETCAIITNGRVTGAAQDFASHNGCRIVGRDEFPDFVLGEVTI